jgi:hypothetical protein
MKKWNEGSVHVAMRNIVRNSGWTLIAGEYPGGSDHELYPLNVVDPAIARDNSPDCRRHSLGELIPDLIAIKGRDLLIAEAKVSYNLPDQEKLQRLLSDRRADLLSALRKFAVERGFAQLLPVETLNLYPVLVFVHKERPPAPTVNFSHLLVQSLTSGIVYGSLASAINNS